MLEDRKVIVEADFLVEHIDPDAKKLISHDEREIPFDLLVTVPLNMGAESVQRSGLGDELKLVPVDKSSVGVGARPGGENTMVSKANPNIFAIGDTSDLPMSKAGSVAHFSVAVFCDNFTDYVEGRQLTESFDGHANCFVESGDGRGMRIDFNYDTEPLTGMYPQPEVGPFSLPAENRGNHLGTTWGSRPSGDVLERHAARATDPAAVPHVHGRQAHRELGDIMPLTTLDGRQIHVNDEGFLTDPAEWDHVLAGTCAVQIGIQLTDAHWKAIRFLREDFAVKGETPAIRRVSIAGGIPVKELFTMFPQKPAEKMAYIAGLPKPKGCV